MKKKLNDVVVEGISFNTAWAASKTKAEFVKEFKEVHFKDYAEEDRTKLLEDAHDKCVAAAEAE
jgi:hypothetical protein